MNTEYDDYFYEYYSSLEEDFYNEIYDEIVNYYLEINEY